MAAHLAVQSHGMAILESLVLDDVPAGFTNSSPCPEDRRLRCGTRSGGIAGYRRMSPVTPPIAWPSTPRTLRGVRHRFDLPEGVHLSRWKFARRFAKGGG